MRRFSCGLVFFVLMATACPSLAAEVSVQGRVLGPGGKPVAGVEVLLAAPPSDAEMARLVLGGRHFSDPLSRATSDANGFFEIVVPHAMVAEFHIEAPGYVPLKTNALPLVESLVLPDSELETDSGLTVKIVGPDRTPIPGAVVMANPRRTEGRGRPPFWSPSLRTGLTGTDGTVKIACGSRETLVTAAGGLGQAPAFQQNARAGKETLTLGPSSRVPIQVRDAAGKNIQGAAVTLGRLAIPCAFTGPDGKALLPLSAEHLVNVSDNDGRQTSLDVSPPAGENPKPVVLTFPATATMNGKVIDALTRKPIPQALVGGNTQIGPMTSTDGQGLFSMTVIAGRTATLRAVAAGYLGEGMDRPIEVSPKDARGVTLDLRPAATVAGKVVDGKGKPLPNALVLARADRPGPGGRFVFRMGERGDRNRTFSNQQGEFKLRGLDPDQNQTLYAKLTGYAPGSLTLEALKPRETRTGIVLELKPGTTASGLVVDLDDHPLSEASVTLRWAPGYGSGPGPMVINPLATAEESSAVTDSEGRFSIPDLASGKYDLTVRRRGFAKKSMPGVDVAGDSASSDLGKIVLEPGAQIQGQVTDSNANPVEGVAVRVPPADRVLAALEAFNPGRENTTTGPDGWFTVDELRPGDKVDLLFSRAGYSEERLDGVEVPPPAPLEIHLKPACTISGLVADSEDQPIPGATITSLRSAGATRGGGMFVMARMARPVTADDAGQFEIQDVEPGKITLTASASGYQQQSLPEIEINPGQNRDDVKFVLQPGAVVQGQVFAPDGSPASGVEVGPVRASEGPIRMSMGENSRTDGDGRYRLENLSPGPASIEATDDDYGRAVKDIEVKAGTTTLDLRFEGGFSVSGRITDENGTPLGDAFVGLDAAGQFFSNQSARSSSDGSFRIEGVKNGDYSLEARAKGFAANREGTSVKVNGAPVTGVVIALKPGGAIVGTVTGLDPESFAQVTIWAANLNSRGSGGAAQPDYKGNFRIDNLPSGTYEIRGTVSNTGRQAKTEATLAAGQTETQAELQFGKGLTLSGVVTQGGEAISGLTVWLNAKGGRGTYTGETDQAGKFSIEGIEAGTYTLQALHFRRGLSHSETVEVQQSRDITVVIPTGKVSGRILDAIDRSALSGASATLTAADREEMSWFGGSAALTDESGRFVLSNVGAGSFRLTMKKDGYATATRDVTVQSGQDQVLQDIALDPTEGLVLRIATSYGTFPESVQVAVIDGSGQPLMSIRKDTGENGSVRVGSVPAGTWELLVQATGTAPAAIQALAPGGPYGITLLPACRLQVTVKDLAGTTGASVALVTGADGKVFRFLGWGQTIQTENRFFGGQLVIENLPPGSWTVTVRAADGRTWSGTATTAAGTPGALTL